MAGVYSKPRKPVNRLLSPLETRFVKCFVEELDFKRACDKSQVSPSAGRKFMDDPAVRTVIGDQVGQILEKTQVNSSRVCEELAVLAFSNIFNIIEVSDDGQNIILKDMKTLPSTLQACVKEIAITPTKFGNTIKVTLHDKMPALKHLAQITALGSADGVKADSKDYGNASTQQLRQIIDRVRANGTDGNVVPFLKIDREARDDE